MTLFTASRVLSITSAAIADERGRAVLQPLKLEGEEGLNRLFEYRLLLQSEQEGALAGAGWPGDAGASLELDGLIGRELTCHIELEGHGSFEAGVAGGSLPHQGAGVREISALITAARCVGPSGRHVLYELTLRPWLHLASLTTDCKVFQDQSPVQIIEAVLGEYPFASDKRLIQSYPSRDYTVQYNESDLEFVVRLMQEWGINYHFEHSGGVHRLIWSDHNGAFQPFQAHDSASPYHHIPYHPPGHKIDREHIHGFSPAHQLTSGSYASRDYDPTRPKALLEARAEAPRPTGHATQEVYLWRGDRAGLGGSDYSQPKAGANKMGHQAANQTEAQGEQLARLRMQALRQGGRRAWAQGHLRGIVPGCSFVLTGHPREQANAEYLVLHTRLLIENVGEDIVPGFQQPEDDA